LEDFHDFKNYYLNNGEKRVETPAYLIFYANDNSFLSFTFNSSDVVQC